VFIALLGSYVVGLVCGSGLGYLVGCLFVLAVYVLALNLLLACSCVPGCRLGSCIVFVTWSSCLRLGDRLVIRWCLAAGWLLCSLGGMGCASRGLWPCLSLCVLLLWSGCPCVLLGCGLGVGLLCIGTALVRCCIGDHWFKFAYQCLGSSRAVMVRVFLFEVRARLLLVHVYLLGIEARLLVVHVALVGD